MRAAATGAFSAGGSPTSEVRGRSREDPMPKRRWPRGVTPRLRSGAVAEGAKLRWCRNGREELPHVRGQGRQPGGPTPLRKPGAAARRTYPTPEARGGSQEDLPHSRGQGWWQGEATPPPRSSGCPGPGGPRGPIPHSRSEGVAVRRYP